MMVKYGTYEIWENESTGELYRKKIEEDSGEGMDKVASGKWKRREDLEVIEAKEAS